MLRFFRGFYDLRNRDYNHVKQLKNPCLKDIFLTTHSTVKAQIYQYKDDVEFSAKTIVLDIKKPQGMRFFYGCGN